MALENNLMKKVGARGGGGKMHSIWEKFIVVESPLGDIEKAGPILLYNFIDQPEGNLANYT